MQYLCKKEEGRVLETLCRLQEEDQQNAIRARPSVPKGDRILPKKMSIETEVNEIVKRALAAPVPCGFKIDLPRELVLDFEGAFAAFIDEWFEQHGYDRQE